MGRHLSDTFLIWNVLKHGRALSPLLPYFALEYDIKKAKANKDALQLNCTHQLPVS